MAKDEPSFKRHQDSKLHSELSKNEGTKRTRAWEKSKVGIDGALLKIKRSRRNYLWRKKQAMMKDPKWLAYSEEERTFRLTTLKQEVYAKYDAKQARSIAKWEDEVEKSLDEQIDTNQDDEDISNIDKESHSEAEEVMEDDEDIQELTEKEKLAVQVGVEAIFNNLRADIDNAMKPFEVAGSYDEEPAEDSSEEDSEVSAEEDSISN